MKIALLGKSGMLGSAFFSLMEADSRFDLVAFDSSSLDVTNFTAVESKLSALKPDFVINCSGYTNVDLAETEIAEAFLLNSDAVANLGRLSKVLGYKLLHFSTDYVFSGYSRVGYLESAGDRPLNVYGESKLAGENALTEMSANAFIVRTAWLFGPGGKNFVDTMIRIGKEQAEVKVVDDQFGSPTYTFDLARAVLSLIVLAEKGPEFGIFHMTNSGVVSWYDFAVKIFDLANVDVTINPVSSVSFSRPAKRPEYGVLVNTKLPQMRPYEEALAEYISLHLL